MLFSLFGSPPIPNSPAWDILIFPNFGEVKINIATNTITPKNNYHETSISYKHFHRLAVFGRCGMQ